MCLLSLCLRSIPKPVFQTTRKSLSYLKNQQQQHHQNHEILSPQHEELVKYMNECKYLFI